MSACSAVGGATPAHPCMLAALLWFSTHLCKELGHERLQGHLQGGVPQSTRGVAHPAVQALEKCIRDAVCVRACACVCVC